MTEQEIVNYLKENHNKGVAFGFMPEEVKEWCEIRPGNILRFFTKYDGKENKKGLWKTISNENYEIVADDIICLPDDYQVKKEPKGEWVEFEIKDSCFAYSHSVGTSHLFDWFDWSFFLKASKKQGWGFTAFGGWQYKNDDVWYMSPRVDSYNHNCHCYCKMYKVNEKNIIPAIPIKIRFWREK